MSRVCLKYIDHSNKQCFKLLRGHSRTAANSAMHFSLFSFWKRSEPTPLRSPDFVGGHKKNWKQSILFFLSVLQNIFTLIRLNPATACPDKESLQN